MALLFVPNLEEFLPVVEGCRVSGYEISGPKRGYWTVRGQPDIILVRREVGLGPALWNTALAGGIVGVLAAFDKDSLTITENVL
jgi:hypothetical protein